MVKGFPVKINWNETYLELLKNLPIVHVLGFSPRCNVGKIFLNIATGSRAPSSGQTNSIIHFGKNYIKIWLMVNKLIL